MLLGVRVQVGMGVRDGVGVAESKAMNVLRPDVPIASAVWVVLSTCTQEADSPLVLVTLGSKVTVKVLAAVADSINTGVWVGISVIVCDRDKEEVEVHTREAVGSVLGETNEPINGLAKNADPKANSTNVREKPSHCQPASIRAWRVR